MVQFYNSMTPLQPQIKCNYIGKNKFELQEFSAICSKQRQQPNISKKY